MEEDGVEDSAAEKKPSSDMLVSDSESQQRSEDDDADSEMSEGEESQPDKEEAASGRSGAKRVKSHA